MSRRFFLKSAGVAAASFGVVPSFLLRTAYGQNTAAGKDRPILIAIFQRGAADGISMVVPFGDSHYVAVVKRLWIWMDTSDCIPLSLH
jgi:uncharacterized protein (DUF1501 family)